VSLAFRVALDTNVVVSALVFGGGWAALLRSGWQAGRFVPLVSAATADELVRVLAYPKFHLTQDDRHDLLADYLPWAEIVTIPDPPPRTPACRDRFDLPFLHLAVAGRARAIVSGDRDLLSLNAAVGLCPVLGPDAFCQRYLTGGGR
jgi:putative PIN family toxin of toxin-antitoxin system